MLFTHQDQVTRLPEGAKLLSGNEHCPYVMATLDDHFLSIQSHPEYTVNYVRMVTETFRGIIPDPVIEAGMASMDDPPDNETLASWVRHFLLGP